MTGRIRKGNGGAVGCNVNQTRLSRLSRLTAMILFLARGTCIQTTNKRRGLGQLSRVINNFDMNLVRDVE
jgi:hypothetical protein